jgi:hypothetical protein
MSWFERHLNWSLFFAIILIPILISSVLGAIFLFSPGGMLPLPIVSIAISLVLTIWDILAILWYLGQKARSKGWIMLIIVPSLFTAALRFYSVGIVGELLGAIVALACLITLFLLQNQAIGYGDNIDCEPPTAGFSNGGGGYGGYGQYGGYDERQLKELDYTPSQNVLDISGSPPAKDIYSMGELPDTGGSSGVVEGAREETPPDTTTQRPATYERPGMPILLDDNGNVISCAYHPGADAVNLCSRCNKYVCIECNYVTGTHPICRNCWERKTEVPLAPPPQKQAKPALSKPVEQQKTAEPAVPVKQEEPMPAEPEVAPVHEVAEQTGAISYEPASQQVAGPDVQLEQETVAPARAEEPPSETAVKPEEQPDIAAVKSEETVVLTPIKPTKQDVETVKWQQEFMAIYQQAAPLINVIIKKGADGMPGSPLDLMEGLKLRPMLTLVKKLSKPKDKELREAKSELEQVISSCIKVADSAADFVGGGGHAMLGGPGFKRIVEGIEKASALMEKLSQGLPSFSRPVE